MKVQTHAKHQKDHADLCELRGDCVVGDITGRKRTDENARQQLADNRRQFELMSGESERKCCGKSSSQGEDQTNMMRNRGCLPSDLRETRVPFEFATRDFVARSLRRARRRALKACQLPLLLSI
jgi:hypothetical protein